mmetsp:Transcript_38477/g.92452  ORF Transcript_38477/g.92452 Transcript_38477/m.92452 type:complete len:200 (-) Transcript_38477:206-805(-)
MPECSARSTASVGLVDTVTIDQGQLLISGVSMRNEFGAVRVEQRNHHLLRRLDLLLCVGFEMDMLRHRRLLIRLVPRLHPRAPDLNPRPGLLLHPLVVDTTRPDNDGHERNIRILVRGNHDLLDQPLGAPARGRGVPRDGLQHVADEPVVLCLHGFLNSRLPAIRSIARFVIGRRWGRFTNIRIPELQVSGLDLSVQIL